MQSAKKELKSIDISNIKKEISTVIKSKLGNVENNVVKGVDNRIRKLIYKADEKELEKRKRFFNKVADMVDDTINYNVRFLLHATIGELFEITNILQEKEIFRKDMPNTVILYHGLGGNDMIFKINYQDGKIDVKEGKDLIKKFAGKTRITENGARESIKKIKVPKKRKDRWG